MPAVGPLPDDPERGDASVLAVTGIGMLAVMAMLGLAGRAVVERRAVEDSLAEVRVYWAAMGQVTYLMARTTQSGAVTNNGTAQSSLVSVASGYLQELADGSGSLAMTWRYPDVSGAYAFTATPTVTKPSGTATGEVVVSVAFGAASGTGTRPEALRTATALRPVQLLYCLLPSATTGSCGTYVPRTQDKHYSRVISVHRQ